MSQAFERLLYTDCRGGEGLGGGPGYQVQAQSAGCTPAQSRMAQGWLLYLSQTKWVGDGRPVEAFPLGFAHASEAGFGTAQSKYLGQEADGGRQGNFLSDCLLAASSAPYGVIRPAQLWRASFWREEVWPTTTAPALASELELGPLDHDTITAWLRSSEARVNGLVKLLTTLEDPQGHRVIIAADEPEQALAWIAAATILLPMAEALEVTFRVFANNFDDAKQRVIGLPRQLYPQLTLGSRPRTFIIDATTDQTDDVEPSPRAQFWVRHLLTASEPYDVVEAVELAAQIGGVTERDRSDAWAAAMAVCDPGSDIEDVAGVGRWLRKALGTTHHTAAQSVVTRLVGAQDVRLDDLRLLDQLASDGTVAVEPVNLRVRLFQMELTQVAAGGVAPNEQLPAVRLSRADRAAAESAIFPYLLTDSDQTVENLLSLAWRHSLSLELPPTGVADRLRQFVTTLLKDQRFSVVPNRLALGQLITDELHGQIRDRFEAGDERLLRTVLPKVVDILAFRGNDMADPFSWEVEGAYICAQQSDARVARVVWGVRQLAAAPETMMTEYQAALVKWFAVDPPTALEIAHRVPIHYPLNSTVLKVALRELNMRSDKLEDDSLGAIQSLYERDNLNDHPRLRRLGMSVKAVDAFLDKLEQWRPGTDFSSLSDELHALNKSDDEIVVRSVPAFVDLAGKSPQPALGLSILRFLRPQPAHMFAQIWGELIRDPQGGPNAAARAMSWSMDTELASRVRDELAAQVEAAYRSAPEPEVWRTSVANHLWSTQEREALTLLLDEPKVQRGSRRFGRS